MTEQMQQDSRATSRGSTTPPERGTRRTPWVGWIWFAAIIMAMLGVFTLIYGLVAIFNDEFYTIGPEGLLLFDITAWGWIHLIIGAVAILTAFALLSGRMWARVLTVLIASVNAIAQLTFLAAYPAWSIIAIVLDILVIWAVVVHGREVDA
ncbi:DUF7144 family membrane protein [Prauserella flavalba]|uniref:DUF7144 domain-containing protein n=1 Tax=Prauserella flavalba TaxID=1477506 RepID=A0A318LFK6_9PSEU|nr:hypothetical protein [Prauserella flavalba]PXY21556.1 hypothetical protein BA062_32110 [Prauserella flavalba]